MLSSNWWAGCVAGFVDLGPPCEQGLGAGLPVTLLSHGFGMPPPVRRVGGLERANNTSELIRSPTVENEVVEVLAQSQVRVCRMPFEPLFASGERITVAQLRWEIPDALTVLAATVVDLMAGAVS
ncbi:hypothetical protein P9209_15965 [Prescottella defluvii]|nr:hypothetical protein P9209_15965 [Prescottella defluvii]